MKTFAFVFLFLLFFSFELQATSEVDKFVEGFMKRKHVPGVALAVVQDGKIVKSTGYGMANLEHQVPVKPETIFQSGSVGKQFTATAVMMLVEEGKLSLDDPVSKYLQTPESWKAVQVRHLLTHTSGLGDYPEDFDFRKDYTEDDLWKIITTQKFAFQPGEKWAYSNLGYVTLGILIHKVSGKFYGDFLQERVFGPLQMTNTRVISESDIIPNRAAGYVWKKDSWKNQEWVSPSLNSTADGALYFNIIDLAKWDAALYSSGLLKDSSLQQMWTPVRLTDGKTEEYGFGWGVGETNGHRKIEHGGGWQGFSTHIARYPDDRLTVIVLTNLGNLDAGYLAHAVAGFYVPEVGPTKRVGIRVDPQILSKYAGKYQVTAGPLLQMQMEGEKLFVTFGEQRAELIPESETSFFMEDSEITVAFVKDENGRIKHALVQAGASMEAIKIE